MNYTDLDLAILKTIITNKKHAIDFVNSSETKIFSTDVWNFANLIFGYIKTFKDVPTLRVIQEQISKGTNKALLDYTTNLWNKVQSHSYDDKEFNFDLNKLKNKYAEKQILQLKDSINTLDKIDVEKSLQEIQKTFQNIKSVKEKKNFEIHSAKDYLPTFREKFLAKRNNPELETGIKTGYSFFDEATGGAKPADFVLIAAESGFGKSTLLLNFAVGMWLQTNTINSTEFAKGHDIAFFSLEMPYEDCLHRFISRLSGVDYKKIERPALVNKEEALKIKNVLDFIHKYPFDFHIIDIPHASSNDIANILDQLPKTSAFFSDYLGIMETNEKFTGDQDWLKQGVIAEELRAVGRARNIPAFSAVQLNRKGGKNEEDAVGLHRLARSAQIATHATAILQIENRKNEENFPDVNCHFIKNRKGPKVKGKLIKNLACATLLDSPANKEEQEFGFTNYHEDISDKMEEIDI